MESWPQTGRGSHGRSEHRKKSERSQCRAPREGPRLRGRGPDPRLGAVSSPSNRTAHCAATGRHHEGTGQHRGRGHTASGKHSSCACPIFVKVKQCGCAENRPQGFAVCAYREASVGCGQEAQKQPVPSQALPAPGLVLGGAKETWCLQAPPPAPRNSPTPPTLPTPAQVHSHSLSPASIDFPTLQRSA